jgi:hypothetical protein
MNCVNHAEVQATAYCRTCGKALCPECQQAAEGTVFCSEHAPAPRPAPPAAPSAPSAWNAAPPPPVSDTSPGLAFVLGLIPGVGAVYNGQYAKGVIHVVILGLLISITSSGAAGGLEPLFGLLIALWFFYMAFEAYHTAKRRQLGQPVDEFSSLVPMKGHDSHFPVAPVVLIAAGVLFLLNNLDLLRLHQILRYWPVFLIALGIYMLYGRFSGARESRNAGEEVPHERQ